MNTNEKAELNMEELEQAPGMTHPAALSVYRYFHEE